MTHRSYREESKSNWGSTNGHINNSEVQLGAILRIADATEIMAKNNAHLIEERDRYKRWYQDEQKRVISRDNRIRSLRGQITKLKKRLL